MIRDSLRTFIDQVSDAGRIEDGDVERVLAEVQEGGLANRIEVEALLALDRTIEACERWASALTRLVVHFVVWRQPPNGAVSNDDAHWLATVLDMGGSSSTGMQIAYAILDEAGHVDVALLDFIMRGRQRARLSSIAA